MSPQIVQREAQADGGETDEGGVARILYGDSARDVSFGEDASTSRTGHGPTNLATLRAAVTTAIQDAGYLYIPEGRRDHTQPIDALYLHDLLTS